MTPPVRRWWAPAPVPDAGPPIGARRAYLEVAAVYLVFFGPSIVAAAASLAGVTDDDGGGWWLVAPSALQEVFQAALAVFVVVVLAERRGRRPRQIGLVARRASGGPGAARNVRLAAWGVTAFLAGGIVTSALATGHFPFPRTDAPNTVLELSLALQSGVVEEVVVLAFLVTTLEQARRPRAEILAVAVGCRMAYHIYYGVGVVGIAVWAVAFVWCFWRFRSVAALIVAHVSWDSLIFLTRVSTAFAALFDLALLGVVVGAVVLWLVERSERPAGAAGVPDWGPPVTPP